ncbi:hypothetical protein HK096_002174, partial [Nowakowskiella sp. JEL0078]
MRSEELPNPLYLFILFDDLKNFGEHEIPKIIEVIQKGVSVETLRNNKNILHLLCEDEDERMSALTFFDAIKQAYVQNSDRITELYRAILARGSDYSRTPIHNAVFHINNDLAKRLIDILPDEDKKKLLMKLT